VKDQLKISEDNLIDWSRKHLYKIRSSLSPFILPLESGKSEQEVLTLSTSNLR